MLLTPTPQGCWGRGVPAPPRAAMLRLPHGNGRLKPCRHGQEGAVGWGGPGVGLGAVGRGAHIHVVYKLCLLTVNLEYTPILINGLVMKHYSQTSPQLVSYK